jgi:acyl-homoserine-lactone acylase
MISAKPKLSLEDIKNIKFDITVSRTGTFAKSLEPVFQLDTKKYPDLKEQVQVLQNWNRVGEINEVAPSLLGLTMKTVFDKKDFDDANFVNGFAASDDEWAAALRNTCDSLQANYGTWKVEWGTVNRIARGNKDLPLQGFADVMSPSYPKKMKGKFAFNVNHGDTYTMFASWGKNGLETLSALQPLGNSPNPESKHYNDQIEMFTKRQMRPLSLKQEEVMKKAEAVYHPQ